MNIEGDSPDRPRASLCINSLLGHAGFPVCLPVRRREVGVLHRLGLGRLLCECVGGRSEEKRMAARFKNSPGSLDRILSPGQACNCAISTRTAFNDGCLELCGTFVSHTRLVGRTWGIVESYFTS